VIEVFWLVAMSPVTFTLQCNALVSSVGIHMDHLIGHLNRKY